MKLYDELSELISLITLLDRVEQRQSRLEERAMLLSTLDTDRFVTVRADLEGELAELGEQLSDAVQRLQALNG